MTSVTSRSRAESLPGSLAAVSPVDSPSVQPAFVSREVSSTRRAVTCLHSRSAWPHPPLPRPASDCGGLAAAGGRCPLPGVGRRRATVARSMVPLARTGRVHRPPRRPAAELGRQGRHQVARRGDCPLSGPAPRRPYTTRRTRARTQETVGWFTSCCSSSRELGPVLAADSTFVLEILVSVHQHKTFEEILTGLSPP